MSAVRRGEPVRAPIATVHRGCLGGCPAAMSPLATQVPSGRTGGMSAAQGHRGRAWEPRGTSPGAYSELAGPILKKKSLLGRTPQNKKTEVVPAPRDRPVSSADRMLSFPRP